MSEQAEFLLFKQKCEMEKFNAYKQLQQTLNQTFATNEQLNNKLKELYKKLDDKRIADEADDEFSDNLMQALLNHGNEPLINESDDAMMQALIGGQS